MTIEAIIVTRIKRSRFVRSVLWPRTYLTDSLQWRHNEGEDVSNHRRLDCLTKLCSGADQRKNQNSLGVVRGIHRWPLNSPPFRTSDTENVSIWWRLHVRFICGSNKTHEGMMCRKPFTGQRTRSYSSTEILVVPVSWLHGYLTDSFHMLHKYKTWGGDV